MFWKGLTHFWLFKKIWFLGGLPIFGSLKKQGFRGAYPFSALNKISFYEGLTHFQLFKKNKCFGGAYVFLALKKINFLGGLPIFGSLKK